MSAMMSQPPPSAPPMPPSGPPPQAGEWTDEMIQQVAQDTGYPVERIKEDIARTGATSPAELYPNFYQGKGIQPQGQQAPPDGQMVSEGVVQGQPPAGRGAPPAMAPPDTAEGELVQSAPPGIQGIDPQVAQAIHSAMKPSKFKRRS